MYDEKKFEVMTFKMLYERGLYKEIKDKRLENEELQSCEVKMLNRFYELEDKWKELLKIGMHKLYKTIPEIENYVLESGNKYDSLICNYINARNEMCKETEEMQSILNAFKEIPELRESNTVKSEMDRVCFEHLLTIAELRKFYARCRKELFWEDYINKLDKLADNGIFLYNYLFPDFPIFDVSEDDLLERFFEVEFPEFIKTENRLEQKGGPLERKLEDINAAYALIKSGFYRSAARNLFSLIEAEHKKGAAAFKGLFEKIKECKNGKERSERLNRLLLQMPSMEWEKNSWKKLNSYYKKMFANKPQGVIHRNSIMHGDYDKESIEVVKNDAIKLLNFFVNIRYISNYLCRAHEDAEMIMPYVVTPLTDRN